LWRLVNGFPPEFYSANDVSKIKDKK